MAQSLTERLQESRLTVVAVDPERGRVRVRGAADACTDLACSEQALVVTDEGTTSDLGALNPGDTIKVESAAGRAQKLIVLRHAWDEIASPEL
jgi:anti-sigma-K factor RskA